MTHRIQNAVADAMTRLKMSDVAGATEAIRNALTGGGSPTAASQTSRLGDSVGRQPGRRLGDVLNGLKSRAGFPSPTARPADQPAPDDPHFTWRSLSSTAGSLNYKLYVPVDRDRELALIVMLHGCTQDPDDFARGTRMNRLADAFGLIVAYPHQPQSANAQGCWNWFDRRHQSAGSGEPAKIAALAQTLAAEFSIAPERVFVAGLSAGAAMADILAETYPQLFAKVGLHSGLPHRAAHDVMSAFAAMKGNEAKARRDVGRPCSRKLIIQGLADRTVHASNADALFDGMRRRHPDAAIVVDDVKSVGKVATRQTLVDASGKVLAAYVTIEGAGHAWSGGDPAGSFAEASGPDASREMVDFFLRE